MVKRDRNPPDRFKGLATHSGKPLMATIAHVAPIALRPDSGMGRVASCWRDSITRRGWSFEHFGADEVPTPSFKALWALSARRAWRRFKLPSSLILAHEPSAEVFRGTGVPVLLFSHGLEARCRELAPVEPDITGSRLGRLLMRPLWAWRSRQTELGLRRCPLLLLINQEDRDYVIDRYRRQSGEIFVFRNGVIPSALDETHDPGGTSTVLVYGTWLERKGKKVLMQAASNIAGAGLRVRWLLVGTGGSRESVLRDWPESLHPSVEVRPRVAPSEDDSIYAEAHVFALPSYFEGQPLTLLQAMESGRCVISTRCCGQKDIIRDGENGFLVEPGDAGTLAARIITALGDAQLRRSVGARAKADMKNRTWERVSDEVTERLAQFVRQAGIHE
jgi:glycosyltransferase involved in cell wall biosynthesis